MVKIANPIYDVVFKYLMKDKKVAKLLLSTIIGREIVDLEFRPTEYHFPVGEMLTVLRMDFSARVLDENGKQELIILELQKAKLASDIMRFRRYLGEQYSNQNNVVREGKPEYTHRRALPILSIYFLGHTLDQIKAPVVRVNRHYVDAATGERIHEREEFIESLTHDSIIIQIPYLKGRRRTELEQLLSLFDQSNQTEDYHFLEIKEEELPERYRPLLRRLQQAIADPIVRETMDAEDDLIDEFRYYQHLVSEKERLISEKDKMIAEKNQTLAKKEKTIAEKEETLAKKEQTIAEKEETLVKKEQTLAENREQIEGAIRRLRAAGTGVNQIADIFQMPVGRIRAILNEQ